MKIHRYILFRPHSVNPIGDAMRYAQRTGDRSNVARERAKTYTETDPGGGDKWREMLLKMSQEDTNDDNE